MEVNCHVNWNSIVYRKGAVHRTEIERPFLAAQGFNTNLAHILPPYHVIISNMHICSPMDVHLKWFYMHKILCAKNYNFRRLDWVPGNSSHKGFLSFKLWCFPAIFKNHVVFQDQLEGYIADGWRWHY